MPCTEFAKKRKCARALWGHGARGWLRKKFKQGCKGLASTLDPKKAKKKRRSHHSTPNRSPNMETKRAGRNPQKRRIVGGNHLGSGDKGSGPDDSLYTATISILEKGKGENTPYTFRPPGPPPAGTRTVHTSGKQKIHQGSARASPRCRGGT